VLKFLGVARTIVFVAGTDTNVGKTLVAAALVRRLRVLGTRAIGMKPVETGCSYGEDHDLIAHDGVLLHRAAHFAAPPLVVSPYRFAPPIAPAVAAELAGLELSLSDLVAAIEACAPFGEPVIVEGAGGALAPIASDGSVLDLAERVGASVLLVGVDRLGVQSHAIAVLESARRRALGLIGVILSRMGEDDALLDRQQNVRMIRERGGVTVFPTIPRLAGDEARRIELVEEHFARCAIGEAILDAAHRP
jgi:dethiobiotin synthase